MSAHRFLNLFENQGTIVYHLTAQPNFRINPRKVPQLNYGMGSSEPGLYVTDSVEHWWNGYGYYRPFVAEIQCNFDLTPYKQPYGHEWKIPVEQFPNCRVLRVIPTDERFAEEYGETYTTQEKRGKGYRFPDDVRTWDPARAKAVSDHIRKWARTAPRGAFV